jgi:hypothetical protein
MNDDLRFQIFQIAKASVSPHYLHIDSFDWTAKLRLMLPSPLGYFRINGGEIRSCNLTIEHRLPERLVFGVKESLRLARVARAKALLFLRIRVLAIVNLAATKQNEPVLGWRSPCSRFRGGVRTPSVNRWRIDSRKRL